MIPIPSWYYLQVTDTVWRLWTDALPEITKGWSSVNVERSIDYSRTHLTRWEVVRLEVCPKTIDHPMSFLMPRYFGEVRLNRDDPPKLTWHLMKEKVSVSEGDRHEELNYAKREDLGSLSGDQLRELAEKAANEVIEWLRQVLVENEPEDDLAPDPEESFDR